MKTESDINDGINALSEMLYQDGISLMQYATLCGMISALSWALDVEDATKDEDHVNAMERLLKKGFVPTVNCN